MKLPNKPINNLKIKLKVVPNADDIFRLFEEGDPNGDARVDKIAQQLDLINDTIEFNLGMFAKLIQNNIVFQEKLKKFFKDIGKDFDEKTTKQASEHTVFNRAWYYLNKVDVDDEKLVLTVLEHNTEYLENSLERSLLYFENTEEYERCAHIHSILEVIKKWKK